MEIEEKEILNHEATSPTKLKQKPQNGIHKYITKDEMPNGISGKFEPSKEISSILKQENETVNNSNSTVEPDCKASGNTDIDELEKRLKETLNVEQTNHPTDVHELDITDSVVSASYGICYVRYKSELQMPAIIHLITKDLSEPYSIYTYRYFIHNWPNLCFLAIYESKYVGAIVCKLDLHKKVTRRGYIAMLAVDQSVRRKKIGSNLVKMAIEAMVEEGCDEVVLETEVTNSAALKLYKNLGFVRDKRLFRYYLNGVDALRLKLWLCRNF